MEALSVMIVTKQLADDIRDSMDGRPEQPFRDVPKRRRSGASAARRWWVQLVGASARNRPVDLRSDHKEAGSSA